MDDTEYMTEAEIREYKKLLDKKQNSVRYEIKKEERETGLNYKLLKSE